MMSRPAMFFIDFDGTISRQDMCCAMVSRFAREGWEEINRLWEAGSLTTEDCARMTLELMEAEPAELESFFEEMEIDPTFIEFVDWAEGQGCPIVVLSDGYDNYIAKAWSRYQLQIPYYANHLVYGPGWKISCPYQHPGCSQCGVCKLDLMQAQLPAGYLSIYIGDGCSDLCAGEHADIVFAKDKLAHLCQERKISYHPYRDFAGIRRKLPPLLKK